MVVEVGVFNCLKRLHYLSLISFRGVKPGLVWTESGLESDKRQKVDTGAETMW